MGVSYGKATRPLHPSPGTIGNLGFNSHFTKNVLKDMDEYETYAYGSKVLTNAKMKSTLHQP